MMGLFQTRNCRLSGADGACGRRLAGGDGACGRRLAVQVGDDVLLRLGCWAACDVGRRLSAAAAVSGEVGVGLGRRLSGGGRASGLLGVVRCRRRWCAAAATSGEVGIGLGSSR